MKICIATGTRAEYGLLKPLIEKVKAVKKWELQILVTGAHLSPEFGLTYKLIIEDGIKIDAKVEMLLSSDSAEGIVKSMGLGMIGFAEAFKNLSPDLIVVLGDRYEIMALAASALIFKIPIVHIHGGEVTEGAYDDSIRHSITKMSHIHFTATEEYRKRVVQLGENPDYVYNVGAIGLDNIFNLKLLSRGQLEKELGLKFKKYNYQVTFHPATLDEATPESQFRELLAAIDEQKDSFFIFTKSNADTDGRNINYLIDDFVKTNPKKAAAFTSLGSLKFLSVLQVCNAIVGNSSSGILEAPSLRTATINIGDRQKGRIQTRSVINCDVDKQSILYGFERLKSKEFLKSISDMESPYGNGKASEKIVKVLNKIDFDSLRTKPFFDVEKI
jgi:GDP/UDP-N,N'-diacetylbacillosamine 2-epimerase (hydrolysing)